MTKQNLIDLVLLSLNNGIPVGEGKAKYHPAEVEKWLEVAYDEFILQVCLAGMPTNDFSGLDSFTKPFADIPVLLDSSRSEYYAILPIPTVQLPEALAIRQVSPMKAPTLNFRYTQYSQQVVMSHLEVGQIDTNPKFYVENTVDGENDRIRFWQGFDSSYDKVLVRLVVPFSVLNLRSEIAIPANKGLALASAVKKIMGERTGSSPDLTNNNNPTN